MSIQPFEDFSYCYQSLLFKGCQSFLHHMRETDPRNLIVQAEKQIIWRQYAADEPGVGSRSKCSPGAVVQLQPVFRDLTKWTVHLVNRPASEHRGKLQVREAQHTTLC